MNGLFSLIILIVPFVLIFYFIKKRKSGGNQSQTVYKKRHEDDDVWKTIKRFLKENGEIGKEIVESYVARRSDPFLIDRSLPKEQQLAQKEEIKKQKLIEKQLKKEAKAKKIPYSRPKSRELYVVLFTTRDAKTGVVEKPRAIECEIKTIRNSNKRDEKTVEIIGLVDYEKEKEWILPIKLAEEEKFEKEYQKQQNLKKYYPNSIYKSYQEKKYKNNPQALEKIKKKELEKSAKRAKKEEEKRQKEENKWKKKESVVKVKA